MTRYCLDRLRILVFGWLHRFMDYLMTPCLPMKMTNWIDQSVLHRRFLMTFYDTWTMRLSVIFGSKWLKLCRINGISVGDANGQR